MVIESDEAMGKILSINQNVEHENYGHDFYYHEPEVARGPDREARGRMKEKLDSQLEKEKDQFMQDQSKIAEMNKRLKDLAK